MRKQLYIVTLILMVMFGVYAAYYYSNYKVQNFPVRGVVSEMPRTLFIQNLHKLASADTNLLYSGLSPKVPNNPLNLLFTAQTFQDTAIGLPNLVFRSGVFGDSTMGYIRRAENMNFQDNYQHSTGFSSKSPFIFTHVHLKQIFRKNFRYYQEYLPFNGERVKALTHMPERATPRFYKVRLYPGAKVFKYLVSIHRSDSSKLVLGMPYGSGDKMAIDSLYKAAEKQISQAKGRMPEDNEKVVFPMLDFQITDTYAENAQTQKKAVQGYTKFTLITNTQYNVLQKPGGNIDTAQELVFDQPFLFYYQDKAQVQEVPVLLAWMAHPSLLLKKSRQGDKI